MIESCDKKRMLIGIGLLGGLTLIVLIVESNWTNHNSPIALTNTSKPGECWTHEKYEIIEPCHPCSSFEIASKAVEACLDTQYKEVLNCEKSGKAQRSCEKVKWIEEKHFWVFESSMFAVAVISYGAVYVRQRLLDRRVKTRVQKQLANGLAN